MKLVNNIDEQECLKIDTPLDKIHYELYVRSLKQEVKSKKRNICESSEITTLFDIKEVTSRNKAREKIYQMKKKFREIALDKNIDLSSKKVNSYYIELRKIEKLIEKKRFHEVKKRLESLIKIWPQFLSIEMSLVNDNVIKTELKNNVLTMIKKIVNTDELSLKLRYIFLLSLDRLGDREVTRIFVDFRSKYSSSEYNVKNYSYKYFLRFLATWIYSDAYKFNRVEEVKKYLDSPLVKKMSPLDLPILKYFYKGSSLSGEQIKSLARIDKNSFNLFELNGLLEGVKNLRFKQDISKYNPQFKKPLYIIKKNFFESHLYDSYFGIFMMNELLKLGAYDLNNLWWFYEL